MLATKTSVFRFADVEVREREFSIIKAGEVVPVEPKAFRVLLFLLHNPQTLITKEELLDAVWGDTAVSENSLTRSMPCCGGCSAMTHTCRAISRRWRRSVIGSSARSKCWRMRTAAWRARARQTRTPNRK